MHFYDHFYALSHELPGHELQTAHGHAIQHEAVLRARQPLDLNAQRRFGPRLKAKKRCRAVPSSSKNSSRMARAPPASS